MFAPRRRAGVLITAIALAGCSTTAAPVGPTVEFGANGGTSVGMPGMSQMPGMRAMSPAPPAGTTNVPAAATGTKVTITNFAFTPPNLQVKSGDTVTWTNNDEEPHTVVAEDHSFHSPGMDANGTFTFTFTTPGTFAYICGIHPFMRGTVVVTP